MHVQSFFEDVPGSQFERPKCQSRSWFPHAVLCLWQLTFAPGLCSWCQDPNIVAPLKWSMDLGKSKCFLQWHVEPHQTQQPSVATIHGIRLCDILEKNYVTARTRKNGTDKTLITRHGHQVIKLGLNQSAEHEILSASRTQDFRQGSMLVCLPGSTNLKKKKNTSVTCPGVALKYWKSSSTSFRFSNPPLLNHVLVSCSLVLALELLC